jgi:hypothetical protein
MSLCFKKVMIFCFLVMTFFFSSFVVTIDGGL